MSMALHASKIAFESINEFLQNKITRKQMKIGMQQSGKNNLTIGYA